MPGKKFLITGIRMPVCLLLTAICAIAMIGLNQSTASASSAIPGEGYTQAAENNSLTLYVNTENLAVIIENKHTGQQLRSAAPIEETEGSNDLWSGFMRSGFAMEYYNDRAPLPVRADAYNGSPQIDVRLVDGGFDATVSYAGLEISFDINVRLTGDGMTAEVPASSVSEGETRRICAIYLYQFMGAALPGQADGYMFIPEGAGALIDLADNGGRYKTPYRKRIFGDNISIDAQSTLFSRGLPMPRDPVPIIMPVYGIAHTDTQTAFLAIAEQGAYNAEVHAYPNGVIIPHNWAAIRFIYREQYYMQITRTSGIRVSEPMPYMRDLKMRFVMLTGDDAGYSGMALAYRRQLEEQGMLGSGDTSYKTRIDFLGAEARKWMFFDRVVPMTTVNQMEDMLTSLAGSGMRDVFALYRGWQSGGLSKNYGSGDFSLEGRLGSFGQLADLREELEASNITLALHQDFLLANPGRVYNTSTNIAKGINQVLLEAYTYAYPYESMYYLTPRRIQELTASYAASRAGEYPIAIGSLGSTLFSYYSRGTIYTREETASGIRESLDAFGGGMAIEQPFMYMLPYTNAYLDMPLYTSSYSYIMADVPFLPMVISGSMPWYAEYVNFQPNAHLNFLKMVEYGAFPSFLLTGESPEELRLTNSSWVYVSDFEIFRDRIIEYADELGALHSEIGGSPIERHDMPDNGVVRVTYENGTTVIVNYGDETYSEQGIDVQAKSYAVYNAVNGG